MKYLICGIILLLAGSVWADTHTAQGADSTRDNYIHTSSAGDNNLGGATFMWTGWDGTASHTYRVYLWGTIPTGAAGYNCSACSLDVWVSDLPGATDTQYVFWSTRDVHLNEGDNTDEINCDAGEMCWIYYDCANDWTAGDGGDFRSGAANDTLGWFEVLSSAGDDQHYALALRTSFCDSLLDGLLANNGLYLVSKRTSGATDDRVRMSTSENTNADQRPRLVYYYTEEAGGTTVTRRRALLLK